MNIDLLVGKSSGHAACQHAQILAQHICFHAAGQIVKGVSQEAEQHHLQVMSSAQSLHCSLHIDAKSCFGCVRQGAEDEGPGEGGGGEAAPMETS